MRLSPLLLALFRFLLTPAIIATAILYLYPAAQNCAFPSPTTTLSSQTTGSSNANAEQCFFDGSGGAERGLRAGLKEAWKEAREAWSRERPLAPFRLLALGDPQLEGLSAVTSRPSALRTLLPRLRAADSSAYISVIKQTAREVRREVGVWSAVQRKKVDLWGNDWFLHHVVWLTRWWLRPTHTVVLGDLLGSQWIGEVEFGRRSGRYWGRVFQGLERVGERVMAAEEDGERGGQDEEDEEGGQNSRKKKLYVERVTEIGSPEYEAWSTRLINVAGNHDIGYAGDIDHHRIERFEREFGKLNWNQRFVLPAANSSLSTSTTSINTSFDENGKDNDVPLPELDIVILNSMNLDGPALRPHLRDQTWDYLNTFINETRARAHPSRATILLTHIPLHKDAGFCADAPFVSYFGAEHGGGIREQNHLSPETSRVILEGLFGGEEGGRDGVVLVGHDHEGCDVLHSRGTSPSTPVPRDGKQQGEGQGEEKGQQHWKARPNWPHPFPPPWPRPPASNPPQHTIREITVRSMMGAYHGSAGLLSAWYDNEKWHFEYSTCVLGVQHIWWAIHVFDVVVVGLGVVGALAWGVEWGLWLRRTRVRARSTSATKTGVSSVDGLKRVADAIGQTNDVRSVTRGMLDGASLPKHQESSKTKPNERQNHISEPQPKPQATPQQPENENRIPNSTPAKQKIIKTEPISPAMIPPTATETVESVEEEEVVHEIRVAVPVTRVTRARRAAARDTERRPSRM